MKSALIAIALLVPVQSQAPMQIQAVCSGDVCQVKRSELMELARQNNINASQAAEAARVAQEALQALEAARQQARAAERKCREVRT